MQNSRDLPYVLVILPQTLFKQYSSSVISLYQPFLFPMLKLSLLTEPNIFEKE